MIRCDRSTSLEDFSNEIFVDTGPNGDLGSAEVSGGLDLDEVGLRSYGLSEKLARAMLVTESVSFYYPLCSCSLYSYCC